MGGGHQLEQLLVQAAVAQVQGAPVGICTCTEGGAGGCGTERSAKSGQLSLLDGQGQWEERAGDVGPMQAAAAWGHCKLTRERPGPLTARLEACASDWSV